MPDLTTVHGNPASTIHTSYQHLMTISDPDQLRQEAIALISQGGISDKNRRTFLHNISKLRTLPQVQSYLTNFMLRAAGLGVI